jgi:hypothetical protein
MEGWRPLGETKDDTGVLYEGVQPWMELAVQRWVLSTVRSLHRLAQITDEFDQRRRSELPIAADVAQEGFDALWKHWNDEADLIPFVDFLLAKFPAKTRLDRERLDEFEADLLRSGSAWRIGTRDGFAGFERRVPLGVQEAADHVMTETGEAGRRLSEAWHTAFGVNPDPSKAYSLAIKAVEDAAKSKTSPNDSVATLGKMIGNVRDQSGWSLPFQQDDPNVASGEMLRDMMRALWAGQVDRHGAPADPEHRKITQEAAETAVLLAVPLVQWFTTGAADRR